MWIPNLIPSISCIMIGCAGTPRDISEEVTNVRAASSRSWEVEACSEVKLRGQSRYTCQNNKIQCLPGWQGDLCQVPICGEDCDPQHGYCTKPGECTCNLGYSGEGCRGCMKLPGCLHGYCRKSFECKCEEGWSGMFCNAPECPSSCNRRTGRCKEPNVCTCNYGYGGENCTDCATPKGCLHGACTKPGECNCVAGWSGRLCDTPVCAPGCKGNCKNPGDCKCDVGWKGENCDVCVAYPGCVNGNCEGPWQCNCQIGWRGQLCDTPTWTEGVRRGKCAPVGAFLCMNGGTEVCSYLGNGTFAEDPRCICPDQFTGTWCENVVEETTKNIQNLIILGTDGPEKHTTETVEPLNKNQPELVSVRFRASTPVVINQSAKLENPLEWVAKEQRYTGSGRRTN